VKRPDEFRDVQALAEFANLDNNNHDPLDRRNFENFRNNYPEFVPQAWWDYRPTDSERKPLANNQWELNQEMLREAWENQFAIGMFDLLRLLTSVFDPNDLTDVAVFPSLGHRPMFATMAEIADPCPYQNAVLYLREHPWQAKVCENCHCYIVVRVAKTRLCDKDECGNSIREINHRASKLRSYHRNKARRKKRSKSR
jgi:hypothetical protein